jgi:hypothetical protein
LIKIVIAMVGPFDLYVDNVLSVKQEAGGVKVVVGDRPRPLGRRHCQWQETASQIEY